MNTFHLQHLKYFGKIALDANEWFYYPETRNIFARVQCASGGPVVFCSIPICSHPEASRYPIKQKAEGLWYISPSVYLATTNPKIWNMKPSAPHPSLESVFLVLTQTPEAVDAQLRELESC